MLRLFSFFLCFYFLNIPILAAEKPQSKVYFDDKTLPSDEKGWQENRVVLPPYPNIDKLQDFFVTPTARLKSLIDPISLRAGSDGIVRYILVLLSQSGAFNVSFEGLRCDTAERKLYAIGRPHDRTWAVVRLPSWQKLSVNLHAAQLALYAAFCVNRAVFSHDARDLLYRLKNQ